MIDKLLWGYVSNRGELLPTTIREKAGDAESALKKSYHHYKAQDCRLVRLRIEIISGAERPTAETEESK